MVNFSLSHILFFDKESTEENAVQYIIRNQIRSTDVKLLDSYAMTFERNERLPMNLRQLWWIAGDNSSVKIMILPYRHGSSVQSVASYE